MSVRRRGTLHSPRTPQLRGGRGGSSDPLVRKTSKPGHPHLSLSLSLFSLFSLCLFLFISASDFLSPFVFVYLSVSLPVIVSLSLSLSVFVIDEVFMFWCRLRAQTPSSPSRPFAYGPLHTNQSTRGSSLHAPFIVNISTSPSAYCQRTYVLRECAKTLQHDISKVAKFTGRFGVVFAKVASVIFSSLEQLIFYRSFFHLGVGLCGTNSALGIRVRYETWGTRELVPRIFGTIEGQEWTRDFFVMIRS